MTTQHIDREALRVGNPKAPHYDPQVVVVEGETHWELLVVCDHYEVRALKSKAEMAYSSQAELICGLIAQHPHAMTCLKEIANRVIGQAITAGQREGVEE